MTLFLSELGSWWRSPDWVGFYCNMIHNPSCWASAHGLFIQHLQLLIFMDSQMLSLMDHLRFRLVCSYRRCLGGLCTFNLLPLICSIGLGCCLGHESIFGAIKGPDSSSSSIEDISTALPWWRAHLARLWNSLFFDVACFLALLKHACFILYFSELPIFRRILLVLWPTWSCPPCL